MSHAPAPASSPVPASDPATGHPSAQSGGHEQHGAHGDHHQPRRRLVDVGDLAYLLYPVLPLGGLVSLARLQGRLQYLAKASARRTVERNLQTVFGRERRAEEIRAITRQFFEYQRLSRLVVMLAPVLREADVQRLARFEGLEHLDRAIAAGKGVILLGSHMNSVFMFLAVVVLRRRGYDVQVSMPTEEDAWARTRLRELIDRRTGTQTLREQLGAFYTQFNIRPIVKRLQSGVIVSQTGDGWHSAGFVEVDFLGRRVPFTTGMMRIAQLTGAQVVPLFSVGAPPDRIRFVFEAPITVAGGPQAKDAVEQAVATYAARLEHYIRENPAGWQHWEIPNTLDAMVDLPRRTLAERYAV